MRTKLWAAGIAVAALLPSAAFAQSSCEQRQHDRKVTGTVIGGIAGAVLGNAVSSGGGKTGGTILGAAAGAAIGNNVARENNRCDQAYGYYDSNGYWHANDMQVSNATGYYDRNGVWVEGAPRGYYDSNGQWVSASIDADAAGYRDANGRWVPVTTNGYYDANGQYVAGAASGYYDLNGNWVPTPGVGHYDDNGRWIPGQPAGHRDANGVWVADAQPGYWSNGRWVRGPVMGYYDARGRWIAGNGTTTTVVVRQSAPYAGYTTVRTDRWSAAGTDTLARENWLERRIRNAADRGDLSRREANRALHALSSIRRDDNMARRRSGGVLSPRRQADIQERLDTLANDVRVDVRDNNDR